MIPAIKKAKKRKAWFELFFMILMGTVSIIYHLIFDLCEYGVKIRHGDWALAMTGPFVLIHYIFRHNNSNFKTIANFYALFICYFLADFFQEYLWVYATILTVHTLILFLLRERHFRQIPKQHLIIVFISMSLGALLFVISDLVIYWILHTYWHLSAFFGMYWVMTIGQTPKKESIVVLKEVNVENIQKKTLIVPLSNTMKTPTQFL